MSDNIFVDTNILLYARDASEPAKQAVAARFARRKKMTLLGRDAFLPTAEDVIIQKLRWSRGAKRSKDFADVVAVLQVQGPDRLDWPCIEEWCTKHQTLDLLAEAKAEATPAWEDA